MATINKLRQMIGFTRNLAHEVAVRGVNVLGVAPGIMIKPEMRQYLLDPRDDKQRAGRDAIREAITTQVQLGRAPLPEEAANMVEGGDRAIHQRGNGRGEHADRPHRLR